MGTRIFLGKPPAKIEQWIKDHYGKKYMTIECLEDGTNVTLTTYNSYDTQTFEVQLNDGDWTTVSWKNDVGFGNAFNLVNKAAGKASMAKGDKLRFRNIDVWAGVSGGAPTMMKITDHAAKLSGKLLDSITQELAESQQSSKFF